jgi:hypothetical protein
MVNEVTLLTIKLFMLKDYKSGAKNDRPMLFL